MGHRGVGRGAILGRVSRAGGRGVSRPTQRAAGVHAVGFSRFGLDAGPSRKHFPRAATAYGLWGRLFPQSWGREDSGCPGLLVGGARSCRRPRRGGWGAGQSRSSPDGGPSSPPTSEAPTKPEPTWRRSGLAQPAGLLRVRAKVCSEDSQTQMARPPHEHLVLVKPATATPDLLSQPGPPAFSGGLRSGDDTAGPCGRPPRGVRCCLLTAPELNFLVYDVLINPLGAF